MKTVKAWAIVGKHGLYEDQRQKRLDIIAAHVHAKCVDENGNRLRFFAFNHLDPSQRLAWEKCKRQGDRCVRVEIREVPRSKRAK